MNVIVCTKQIPEPTIPPKLHLYDKTLVREGRLVLDEADAYGVELGLRLVQEALGGEVTLVSMVPGGEMSGLRTALAMGAHRAIVVSDPLLAGSDALSTAKVLAAAIRRVGPKGPDLVLTGTESTDGATGTLPVQLAEVLGLPALTFAKHVELVGDRLRVRRQTDAGYDEVECVLPCLVTLTAGVVEPRYPSFAGIMMAKHKPIEEVTVADLGLAPDEVGWAGARQEVVDIVVTEQRTAGEMIEDRGDAHQQILQLLEQLKLI